MNIEVIITLALSMGPPILLTVWNIFTFIKELKGKKEKERDQIIEFIAMIVGALYTFLYLLGVAEIQFGNWDTQLYNDQRHSIIDLESFLIFFTLSLVAFFGYFVSRFIPLSKKSPLLSVLALSAIYLGIIGCILWCVQTSDDSVLLIFPLNCIIIFIKTIIMLVRQKADTLPSDRESAKFKTLSRMLHKSKHWPWLSFILALPLLGIIVAILIIFGQEPDSIIRVWTETADWTLSERTAPPNIIGGHYLCTVAAGGHKKIVKPLRVGIRHGHGIIVNRQLCIANAFEQILEEKIPVIHRVIRNIYDKTGYPLSRHIHSPYIADIFYYAMKPLEWIFLVVLYLVDTKPENRIAVQYPHSTISEA